MRDEANDAARLKLEELKTDPDAYRLMRDGENEAARLKVRTRVANEYTIPLTTGT